MFRSHLGWAVPPSPIAEWPRKPLTLEAPGLAHARRAPRNSIQSGENVASCAAWSTGLGPETASPYAGCLQAVVLSFYRVPSRPQGDPQVLSLASPNTPLSSPLGSSQGTWSRKGAPPLPTGPPCCSRSLCGPWLSDAQEGGRPKDRRPRVASQGVGASTPTPTRARGSPACARL